MKKQVIAPVLFLLSVIAFNLLFWQEQLGVNTLLFTLLLTAVYRTLYPESFLSRSVQLTLAGTWLAAFLVTWHHSLMSQVTYMLSLLVMTGMVHRPQLRFLGYGLLLSLVSAFEVPVKCFRNWPVNNSMLKQRVSRTFYVARITVLPLLIVSLFYVLYIQASDKFANLTWRWWSWVGSWFTWQISIEQVMFILLSILVMGGAIWRSRINAIPTSESADRENLQRIRNKTKPFVSFNLPDLRKEYQMALISMFSLNSLLLLFNLTDLNYVWLTKAPATASQLKAYVHEGTYILIFSILLAMGVLLFFFRKNLNFYPKNQLLKSLAYLWVGQNALLVLSVALRNYRYIDAFGLAYKRIGVVIFLILVLYGLWSIIQKIRDCKHSYFLFHRNAWALYWVILFASTVNWDIFITRYNLTHLTMNPVDALFLLRDVSDKNLYVLLEQQEQFLQRESYPAVSLEYKQSQLERKEHQVLQKAEKYSWLSWNYADYRNRTYLNGVQINQ